MFAREGGILPDPTATLALKLAGQACDFYAEKTNLQPVILNRAALHLLDHLGNAAGGSRAESSKRLRGVLGRVPGGPFTVICGRGLALPEYAALLNGAAAHALESDDTHNGSSTHPGAAVIPAALAAAEMTGANGRSLLAAIVAGYEVMTRLGMALGPAAQYARGFHPTATCGVFGASTAAGLLLGLTSAQLASAYGICGSQSSGLLEFLGDGSLVKRLHPGWAAHSGILAAQLAQSGFSGPLTVFEGVHGLFKALSAEARPELLVAGDWSHPQILETSIKTHACCRYKQAPIDALLQCVRTGGFSAGDVEMVEIGTLSVAWDVVAEPRAYKLNPRTVVDAQFSMPYGAAVALIHGRATVQEYTEAALADPTVRALMPRIHCVREAALDTLYPAQWPATARVRTRNGREYFARVDYPKGDPENPLSDAELATKFRALAGIALSEKRLGRIIGAVNRLTAAETITPLTALLEGVPDAGAEALQRPFGGVS